ncbi:MAG: FliH/SctL family protein [Alphaproteobacteria bacterium]
MEKFLFDTSFDSSERARPEPEPEPEPTFGISELEAARAAAFAEGQAAGETAALQRIDGATRDALGQIDGRLGALREQLGYVADQARRDGMAVAMAAIRTLYPRLAATHGLQEIETVVAQCLELARHEPAIVFKFHPDVQEQASAPLEAMAAARAYPGKLVILADPKLPVDGCAVEWADGGAERNCDALMEQIQALVAQAMGGNAQPASPAATAAEAVAEDDGAQEAR